MALVIGNGTITGLDAGGLNDGALTAASIASGTGVKHKYVLTGTSKTALFTGITDSNTTTTRTATMSNYISMTNDIRALILRVRYQHNGGANHGYFNFKAYQNGNSSNYMNYESYHFDWYFNTTNETLIVPWDYSASASNDLKIECTASYNTSGNNTYAIHFEGVIKGNYT